MADTPKAAATATPSKPAAADSRRKAPAARAEAPKPAPADPAEAAAPPQPAAVERAADESVSPPQATVNELKEDTMSTNPSTDFTQPITQAIGDLQSRAKAAYDKSTEVAGEVAEFAKGNVEAFVESSKIFTAGAQSLGRTYAEEAKSAYETMTADAKELAAVKSPAELFQLQSQILRRNFDTLVATSSKNGEAVLKLASDSFAPFTGRVNVAAEKFSKVA